MPPLKADEPAALEVGTEVSARFNGAFCEAKIRSYSLDLRLKIRDPRTNEIFVARNPNIITELKKIHLGGNAVVRHPNKSGQVEGTILQVSDYSTYTVEFNDGDVKSLKRSSLHLQSGKHFDESLSLDNLPLVQPEKSHLLASTSAAEEREDSAARSASVIPSEAEESEGERKRRTRRLAAIKNGNGGSGNERESRAESESTEPEKTSPVEIKLEPSTSISAVEGKIPKKRGRKRKIQLIKEESVEQQPSPKASTSNDQRRPVDYPVGSSICIPLPMRKRYRWTPAIVVHPESRKKTNLEVGQEVLVRLFSNGSYRKVSINEIKPFTEDCYCGPEEEQVQRQEPDYALIYLKEQKLPPTWSASIFQPREDRASSDDGNETETVQSNRDDTEDDSEATRFMITFIKYRDEIGKPYDEAPQIDGKAVDMYKLHKLVHEVGGFNRCNQENRWMEICDEMELKSAEKGADLKAIYANYLHGGFETIYRNLGTSITDIRLGRKRHQPQPAQPVQIPSPSPAPSTVREPTTTQEPSAEPERRASLSSSPTTPQPKRRGRPPNKVRLAALAEKAAATGTPASKPISQQQAATPVVIKVEPAETFGEAGEKAKSVGPTGSVESEADGSDEKDDGLVIDEAWKAIRKQYAAGAEDIPDTSVLRPGAVVEVLYRNIKAKKVLAYNARILDNVGDVAFFVHYASWNKRYDEWIPLQAIIRVVDLSEVGSKPYQPNPAFKSRIRNKLYHSKWQKWRPALAKHMSFSDAVVDESIAGDREQSIDQSETTEAPPKLSVPRGRGRRKRSISMAASTSTEDSQPDLKAVAMDKSETDFNSQQGSPEIGVCGLAPIFQTPVEQPPNAEAAVVAESVTQSQLVEEPRITNKRTRANSMASAFPRRQEEPLSTISELTQKALVAKAAIEESAAAETEELEAESEIQPAKRLRTSSEKSVPRKSPSPMKSENTSTKEQPETPEAVITREASKPKEVVKETKESVPEDVAEKRRGQRGRRKRKQSESAKSESKEALLAVEGESSKTEEKRQPVAKKAKPGRTKGRPKPAKKESPKLPTTLSWSAPAFAAKHSSGLSRLGLPLDGSEGTGPTVIEEDEYGNIVKLIVEGVDLTDPDCLEPNSTSATSRIEMYEQNLVDTLLVSQLLIHRLASGYHILKRIEDRDADNASQSDAQSEKSEPDTAGRTRSLRSK